MMDDNQKQQLKASILVNIDQVKKDIEAYRELSKPVSPDSSIGRLTRQEAISSRSINESALEKSKTTLDKLQRALSKIDHPDFGICVDCEEPIPFARLAIMPETVFCVRCAENFKH